MIDTCCQDTIILPTCWFTVHAGPYEALRSPWESHQSGVEFFFAGKGSFNQKTTDAFNHVLQNRVSWKALQVRLDGELCGSNSGPRTAVPPLDEKSSNPPLEKSTNTPLKFNVAGENQTPGKGDSYNWKPPFLETMLDLGSVSLKRPTWVRENPPLGQRKWNRDSQAPCGTVCFYLFPNILQGLWGDTREG